MSIQFGITTMLCMMARRLVNDKIEWAFVVVPSLLVPLVSLVGFLPTTTTTTTSSSTNTFLPLLLSWPIYTDIWVLIIGLITLILSTWTGRTRYLVSGLSSVTYLLVHSVLLRCFHAAHVDATSSWQVLLVGFVFVCVGIPLFYPFAFRAWAWLLVLWMLHFVVDLLFWLHPVISIASHDTLHTPSSLRIGIGLCVAFVQAVIVVWLVIPSLDNHMQHIRRVDYGGARSAYDYTKARTAMDEKHIRGLENSGVISPPDTPPAGSRSPFSRLPASERAKRLAQQASIQRTVPSTPAISQTHSARRIEEEEEEEEDEYMHGKPMHSGPTKTSRPYDSSLYAMQSTMTLPSAPIGFSSSSYSSSSSASSSPSPEPCYPVLSQPPPPSSTTSSIATTTTTTTTNTVLPSLIQLQQQLPSTFTSPGVAIVSYRTNKREEVYQEQGDNNNNNNSSSDVYTTPVHSSTNKKRMSVHNSVYRYTSTSPDSATVTPTYPSQTLFRLPSTIPLTTVNTNTQSPLSHTIPMTPSPPHPPTHVLNRNQSKMQDAASLLNQLDRMAIETPVPASSR